MVSQLSEFLLTIFIFQFTHLFLCSVCAQSFFLKSLVFGGHLSDVHATPSSNLACPDLVRYLPCRAHFLTYLKETDNLVLFLEVLFDTQSLIFFFSFKSLTLSVPFCHPFCHPSCQDPYTWINTVASWPSILRFFQWWTLSPHLPRNWCLIKAMLHLHWTFETSLTLQVVFVLHLPLWAVVKLFSWP